MGSARERAGAAGGSAPRGAGAGGAAPLLGLGLAPLIALPFILPGELKHGTGGRLERARVREYALYGYPIAASLALTVVLYLLMLCSELGLDMDQVRHPYRFLKGGEPFQSRRSTAVAEQIESVLTFILSGRHIGYLPCHCAQGWEAEGLLWALDPELDFGVPFTLARHRAQGVGEAAHVFAQDLLAAFA